MGRGVGLDVVAHEIETLSGRIDVESLEGQGTSIRISLPYPGAPATTLGGTSSQESSEPADSQRGATRLTLVRKKYGTTDKPG